MCALGLIRCLTNKSLASIVWSSLDSIQIGTDKNPLSCQPFLMLGLTLFNIDQLLSISSYVDIILADQRFGKHLIDKIGILSFAFHWAGRSCTICKHLENIHGDETRKKLAMLRHGQQWWRPEGPSSSSESVYTFLHDLESRLCASISIFIFFHDLESRLCTSIFIILEDLGFWQCLIFLIKALFLRPWCLNSHSAFNSKRGLRAMQYSISSFSNFSKIQSALLHVFFVWRDKKREEGSFAEYLQEQIWPWLGSRLR